jgi:hypothetical protein
MGKSIKARIFAPLIVCLIEITPGITLARNFSLAIYGGQLTREKWEYALSPEADYADATIAVAAASWTAFRFFDGNLSFELEAQAGKYFGGQNNWEFNLPILGFRWHRFPWDDQVATSLAWGIGPSYATRVPKIELETNDDSSRWLIYWFGELTFGPPTANWEVLTRMHHRSNGFGAVANDGGSTAVAMGLRYHF